MQEPRRILEESLKESQEKTSKNPGRIPKIPAVGSSERKA